jgi:hypothetical protein
MKRMRWLLALGLVWGCGRGSPGDAPVPSRLLFDAGTEISGYGMIGERQVVVVTNSGVTLLDLDSGKIRFELPTYGVTDYVQTDRGGYITTVEGPMWEIDEKLELGAKVSLRFQEPVVVSAIAWIPGRKAVVVAANSAEKEALQVIGPSGQHMIPLPDDRYCSDIAADPEGKIVLVGTNTYYPAEDLTSPLLAYDAKTWRQLWSYTVAEKVIAKRGGVSSISYMKAIDRFLVGTHGGMLYTATREGEVNLVGTFGAGPLHCAANPESTILVAGDKIVDAGQKFRIVGRLSDSVHRPMWIDDKRLLWVADRYSTLYLTEFAP